MDQNIHCLFLILHCFSLLTHGITNSWHVQFHLLATSTKTVNITVCVSKIKVYFQHTPQNDSLQTIETRNETINKKPQAHQFYAFIVK